MNKLFRVKTLLLIIFISLIYSCQRSHVKDNSNKEIPITTKQIKHNVFSERCFREANWIHYVLHFDKDYIRVWGLSDTITYLNLEKQVTSYLTDSYYVYEMVSGYPSGRSVENYGDGNLTDCLYLSYDNKEVRVFFDKKNYVYNRKLNEWSYIDLDFFSDIKVNRTCSGITNLIENLSTTQKKEFDVKGFTQRLKKARESIKGKVFDPVPSYFEVANDTLRIQGNVFLPE